MRFLTLVRRLLIHIVISLKHPEMAVYNFYRMTLFDTNFVLQIELYTFRKRRMHSTLIVSGNAPPTALLSVASSSEPIVRWS